ncbi:MAG: hypothetical protein RIQ47_1868 [Bacteroidota bacterium]|jgi:hypothetical protein
MNRLLLLLIVWLPLAAIAQNPIPNAGFESWNGDLPQDWTVNNSASATTVTRVSDPFQGNFALRGTVVSGLNSVATAPLVQSMNGNYGFPVDASFTELNFQFKSFLYAGDRFNVNVFIYNSSFAVVGGGSASITSTENNYLPFTVPVTHFAPGAALAMVSFTIAGNTGSTNGHVLSWFQIDALSGPNVSTAAESPQPVLPFSVAPLPNALQLSSPETGDYFLEGFTIDGRRQFCVQQFLAVADHQKIDVPELVGYRGLLLLRISKDGRYMRCDKLMF